jgi:hypothetical protein
VKPREGQTKIEEANMESLHDAMLEYRKQLEKGVIQKAYRGLMGYLLDLRTHFQNQYPEYVVSGSLYAGYMDMTYFSFFPKTFKQRNLKVAIVYLHETGRFEAWLAGQNKQVQTQYWKLIKESDWNRPGYHLVAAPQGADSILECVLVDHPDFRDLDALTQQIERETMEFIQEVDRFLTTAAPQPSQQPAI